jgi:hypothetical protein
VSRSQRTRHVQLLQLIDIALTNEPAACLKIDSVVAGKPLRIDKRGNENEKNVIEWQEVPLQSVSMRNPA